MKIQNKTALRRPLLTVYLGMAMILAACGSVTPIPAKSAPLRLESGAVQVQDEHKDWVSVGAETTFELAGRLESVDPWMVTGNTFATRDSTRIAEGLEAGHRVQVQGFLLEDGTWLASSIELAQERVDPAIVLTGKVDSVDPWMIHGITLDVTEATVVSGKIAPGMIVEVDILLLENGDWEVLSLAPLSTFTEIPGCAAIPATVRGVEENEVQFTDWPEITLGADVHVENESGKPATLSAHPMVLVVVCRGEDGQSAITKVIVLKTGTWDTSTHGEKVWVCHKPDKKGGHTLSIAAPAVSAHLAHGDKLGACPKQNK